MGRAEPVVEAKVAVGDGVLVEVGRAVVVDGTGEAVKGGVTVKTGMTGIVDVGAEVVEKYGSYVPHKLLPQAERRTPIRIIKMAAL